MSPEQLELVAGDEARPVNQVRRADRPRGDAQVRDRDGARLLRVVDEVGLDEGVALLAEDLDRVAVRPDRAVGAQAEEDGAGDLVRLDVELGVVRQRRCVTSSTMPTVKWLRGCSPASSSKTALTIAGVNSLDDSP
jgi:hypothetical protein